MCSTNIILLSRRQDIKLKIVFFFKFIISVTGDYIDVLPRCQKKPSYANEHRHMKETGLPIVNY